MPMFDYKCLTCEHVFEELVFSSSVDDSEISCPNCGERTSKRLLSAPMVSVGKGSTISSGAGCNPSSGFT